tara:strand:+ start:1209 stop:1526 length:318 start_codon:yes stop_codon:yes gene_type:complete
MKFLEAIYIYIYIFFYIYIKAIKSSILHEEQRIVQLSVLTAIIAKLRRGETSYIIANDMPIRTERTITTTQVSQQHGMGYLGMSVTWEQEMPNCSCVEKSGKTRK